MVLVNYAGREINAKLVYYGPGLSGKTTNLEYIYTSVPATHRGKMVSMKTKTERTLFFDFLPLDLGELGGYRTRFLLYTVPGQVYYNATRKLVLKGVDAVVFVADSKRAKMDENRESLQNLRDNLKELGLDLEQVPWVLQYNKRDLPDAATVEELTRALNPGGVPSILAVAARGDGVFDTFREVSKLLLRNLSKNLGPSVLAKPTRPAPAAHPAVHAEAPKQAAIAPPAAAPRAPVPAAYAQPAEPPPAAPMPPVAPTPPVQPPMALTPQLEPPIAVTPVAPPPEAPRMERPRLEGPFIEGPRAEALRVEGPRAEESRVEGPRDHEPRSEAPPADERSFEAAEAGARVEAGEPRFIISDAPVHGADDRALAPAMEPEDASKHVEAPAEMPDDAVAPMAASMQAAPEPAAPETGSAGRRENGKSDNGRSKSGLFGWLRRSKGGGEAEELPQQPAIVSQVPVEISSVLEAPAPGIGEGEALLSAVDEMPPVEPDQRPRLELLRGTTGVAEAVEEVGEPDAASAVQEITVPVILPANCAEVRLVVRLLVSHAGGDREEDPGETIATRAG